MIVLVYEPHTRTEGGTIVRPRPGPSVWNGNRDVLWQASPSLVVTFEPRRYMGRADEENTELVIVYATRAEHDSGRVSEALTEFRGW